jgi:lactoylglutathione lyase
MFRDAFPIIYVADLPAALTFYRDLLGYTVTYEFPPSFAGLTLGAGPGLALAATSEDTPGSHGRPVRLGGGHQFELCVYTDDLDAALTHLRSHDVPVLVEPADQPWGERMAYVADPDGHPVMICQTLAAPPPEPR